MRASVITSASTSPALAEAAVSRDWAPQPRLAAGVGFGQAAGENRLECDRGGVVGRLRGLHPGPADPRVVGPCSRGAGGHRPGDQEDGEQADPDPGLGPVTGPAERIAIQPQRAGQPRDAARMARSRVHAGPPGPAIG